MQIYMGDEQGIFNRDALGGRIAHRLQRHAHCAETSATLSLEQPDRVTEPLRRGDPARDAVARKAIPIAGRHAEHPADTGHDRHQRLGRCSPGSDDAANRLWIDAAAGTRRPLRTAPRT
jgi:hypothetical protein